MDQDYAVKVAEAEGRLARAEQNMKSARNELFACMGEMEKIQKGLVQEVEEQFRVDPDKLDSKTLELLKSGILTDVDFEHLYQNAVSKNNITMVRLIGKYAGDAAQARKNNPLYGGDDVAKNLESIRSRSQEMNGQKYIEAGKNMIQIYKTCVNNPGIMDKWQEIVGTF